VIFTTGGTGIGPRDITPEVVTEFSDKLVPGIMDHIRMKYGQTIPNALLSRSVAAVKDKTLIYTLPGSVKAVTEYMDEILKTIDHLFKMLNGEGH
jgi:molybdopterin adenylyltransferase